MSNGREVALFIQSVDDFEKIDLQQYESEGKNDFTFYYDYLFKESMKMTEFDSPDCIYYGAEFCENALPDPEDFLKVARECKKRNLRFAAVTPPSSDSGVEKVKHIVEKLNSEKLFFEVVVNDLGVLKMLSETEGDFVLSIGRVMDKRPHDARLSRSEYRSYLSEDGKNLTGEPGILSSHSLEKLRRMNIQGIELDEPVHDFPMQKAEGKGSLGKSDHIKTTLHLPCGFLTTGRLCPFKQSDSIAVNDFPDNGKRNPENSIRKASNKRKREHEWRPDSTGCRRLCREINQMLTRPAHYSAQDTEGWRISNTALFRKGNTLFYPIEELSDERLEGYDRIVLHLRLSA